MSVMLGEIDFPKSFLKKNIKFYKAYFLEEGERMELDVHDDIYGLTEEAAIYHLINNGSSGKEPINTEDDLRGKDVSFVEITIPKDEFEFKPLVMDTDTAYFNNNCIVLTIKEKDYKMKTYDKIIDEISLTINPANEIKNIDHIKLINA